MTERSDPDNADAGNTSAPNQQTNPDWNAIGSFLASAITNAAKAGIPQEKKRDPIPLLNLILTLFIAVGGIIGGYLVNSALNGQNENINKEVALFSSSLQFAHLEVSCIPDCKNAEFQVKNDGPGTATNLNITIVLVDISNPWKSRIKSIAAFMPRIYPFSIPKSITKTNIADAAVLHDDAYTITLATVPPQEAINISLMPLVNELGSVHTYHAHFDYKEYADKPPTSNDFQHWGLISSYAGSFFEMASFEVNATCNICQGDTEYKSRSGSYVNQSGQLVALTVRAPSVEDQVTTESNQSSQGWGGYVDLTYILPDGIKPPLVPAQINLRIRNTGTPNEYAELCSTPSDCLDFSQ